VRDNPPFQARLRLTSRRVGKDTLFEAEDVETGTKYAVYPSELARLIEGHEVGGTWVLAGFGSNRGLHRLKEPPRQWGKEPLHEACLSAAEMQALKVGDRVRIFWAKDGDLRDIRVDEVHVVRYVDTRLGEILTDQPQIPRERAAYTWDIRGYSEQHRAVDTSRGYAYFTKAD
jgi:hypothetical protein